MSEGRFTFQSKARNLAQLKTCITAATIPAFYIVRASELHSSRSTVLQTAAETFGSKHVIVRSSAACEDSSTSSHAGEYTSVANVIANDHGVLSVAIDSVIASYTTPHADDEVLIQEQVQNIAMSGVLFTRDLDTLAPYFVVNYETSGSTDGITSGNAQHSKTFIQFRGTHFSSGDKNIRGIITLAEELMSVTGDDALDIEFAVDSDGIVNLLQVRQIVRIGKPQPIDHSLLARALFRVEKKLEKLNGPHPGVHGNNAIYSVMTDWNPAEIIGTKPRMLARSLYKELIMDGIWAYQRSNYGYKNLRGFPLLVSFLGAPYIDVRASFNSFIPASLDEALTKKLADYYAKKLQHTPTDHDKVEFKIVYSCYFFNVAEKLKELLHHGFSELEIDRIKFSLLQLTNRVIAQRDGLYRSDQSRVEELNRRFFDISNGSLPLVDKIYWLIEDCKRYGTLPFAGLARAGFIAVQMLRSLVELNILTAADLNRYLNSLNTVSKQLVNDFAAYRKGALSQAQILERYGHLRPGTYDILSARYDEAFDTYFDDSVAASTPDDGGDSAPFEFSKQQQEQIEFLLLQNGILASFKELFVFIKEAIEGREFSKFVFTRSLSHVLLLLEQLGKNAGITKDEMSHLDIKTVIGMYASVTSHDVSTILRENIARNEAEYEVTKAIKLPELITQTQDLYLFHLADSEPNFVTQHRIVETVIREGDLASDNLKNRIVMIRSADPGYDWLFSRNIGGLVTMYGGSNSHMAIRCAELQIPAAIGCGERLFEHLALSAKIEIDCAARLIRRIS